MSNQAQAMRAAQDALATSKVIFRLATELNWAIHHLEQELEASNSEDADGETLLTALMLLSDFAITAGTSYSAARHGLLLEHMKKPRNRTEAARSLLPGLANDQQVLEDVAGPALLRFVRGLPGTDLDIVEGRKPARTPPPES